MRHLISPKGAVPDALLGENGSIFQAEGALIVRIVEIPPKCNEGFASVAFVPVRCHGRACGIFSVEANGIRPGKGFLNMFQNRPCPDSV